MVQSGQTAESLPTDWTQCFIYLPGARGLISWVHNETLLIHFQLAIVCVDQDADFACVAPLSDVLFSFTFDDFLDICVLQPFRSELFNPLGQLVGVTNRQQIRLQLWPKSGKYLRLFEGFGHASTRGLIHKIHVSVERRGHHRLR